MKVKIDFLILCYDIKIRKIFKILYNFSPTRVGEIFLFSTTVLAPQTLLFEREVRLK